MRLVVLYQGKALEDHPGYHEGFQRLKTEGVLTDYRAIPYYGVARDRGWPALWDEAQREVRDAGADAVFLQFFHGSIPDPSQGIAQLRSSPTRPTLFTSLGDPFGTWLRPVPSSFRIASRLAALNFMTGMGRQANGLARLGTRNLVLMPNGACQRRFAVPLDCSTYQPEFDVVFIGSRMRSRWIVGSASWFGIWRDRLVARLTRRFGRRFGLFGHGWDGHRSWQGAVPYSRQHEALRRSRIQIGGYPNSLNDYYTSDRAFIALAAGIPFVDYWVSGVECFFQNGTEWWLGRTLDQMVDQVDKLLGKPVTELLQLGEAVRQEILAHHTQYNRCQQMIEIVARYRERKQAGKRAELPTLPFLRYPWASGSRVGPAVSNWYG